MDCGEIMMRAGRQILDLIPIDPACGSEVGQFTGVLHE
jgi:hypothetical protein